MHAWVVWIIVAAVFVVAELFNMNLVFVMFGVGALAAALVAAPGLPVIIQALVFAAVSLLCVLGVRPFVRRFFSRGQSHIKSGIEALKGQEATVLSRVDEDKGLVKIGGEEWSARAYDSTQVHEVGEKVRVIDIKGATALVWRQP